MLLSSAVVQQTREQANQNRNSSRWTDVLNLQSGVLCPEIDLRSGIEQILPFARHYLRPDLAAVAEVATYPYLSRHLSHSLGILESPVGVHSESVGSAMHPSGDHGCDSNAEKDRGEVFLSLRLEM